MKKYKEIVRSGLILLWFIGLLMTLVKVPKDPNIVIITIAIILIGMIGTKEPIIILAIIEWSIFLGYFSFIGYIFMQYPEDVFVQHPENVIKILVATGLFILFVMIRRIKNFSNYIF